MLTLSGKIAIKGETSSKMHTLLFHQICGNANTDISVEDSNQKFQCYCVCIVYIRKAYSGLLLGKQTIETLQTLFLFRANANNIIKRGKILKIAVSLC